MPEGNGDVRDRSVAELVKELADETTTLVRKEVELARAEFGEKLDAARADVTATVERARTDVAQGSERVRAELSVHGKRAGIGGALYAGAGSAGLLALGALTAFLILALDGVMPNWAAALVVTGVWALVAAALYLAGREQMRDAFPLISPRTVEALKEDASAIVAESKERLGDAAQPVPEQTVETLKEDVEWAKDQKRSAGR